MEFNVFEHFKGFKRIADGPMTPQAQGSALFLGGHLGEQISPHVDAYAQKAGVSRRNFLGTASGFAATRRAVNKVTVMIFFDVAEAEPYDGAAASEIMVAKKAGTEFIVDQHTHICIRKDGYIPGVNTTEKGMWFVQLLDDLGKAMGLENGTKDMTVENFGKLILDGSDTSVAIFNPFGFREDYGGKDMVPIEEQAEVKQRWPDRTVMMGGGLTPNQGLGETLDRLQMFVETYKISGLKLYTFDSTPQRGWWFDDVKLAYPIWEKCRKLGIKNIGCHKGIPFGQFMARYAHAEDFDAVCDDFLDLNFIAFHSGWPYHTELAALKGFKPQRKNMYLELGSTFAATVTNRPVECAHILGTLLRDVGTDYVMWGTDSALWGNPQWQIDAFRKFRIPDQLVDGYGYPQLTDEIKAKVLGLNAARLWNLKPMSAKALPEDKPRIAAA
jgi:hypothetical protein